MCGLRVFLRALFFLLALGPHIIVLHAQDSSESPDSDVSTISSVDTEFQTESPAESTASVDSEEPEMKDTFSQKTAGLTEVMTTKSSTTSTSFKDTVVTQESVTLEQDTKPSEPTEPSVTMVTPTKMEPHTAMITGFTATGFTTAHSDETTVVSDVITTTIHSTFPTQVHEQTSASGTMDESTKTTETISTLITHAEKRVQTTLSTMATTQIVTTLYQHPVTPHVTDSTTEETTTSKPDVLSTISKIIERDINSAADISNVEQNFNEESSSGSNWLIIIIIAVAIICIVAAFCVFFFVRRNKKSRSQRFGHGYTNGRNQRSKKKKGEEDAWAGPVNLEGGDKAECYGPDDMGQGDDKNPDGTDMMLSTFVASEGKGGVGRPGSMEVQKWEEQEPLLYIDEEAKAEAKEKQNEGVGKANEVGQKEDVKTDMKEPEQSGGDAFCITTAV